MNTNSKQFDFNKNRAQKEKKNQSKFTPLETVSFSKNPLLQFIYIIIYYQNLK